MGLGWSGLAHRSGCRSGLPGMRGVSPGLTRSSASVVPTKSSPVTTVAILFIILKAPLAALAAVSEGVTAGLEGYNSLRKL
jgi:hypothetical protein